MILLRPVLLALLLLITPVAFAQTGDADWLYRGSDIARDPAWRFGTLPNGLHYAVRRNALPAGQVSIRIRIDAGSLHEEDDQRGWAHFVEHMLFRGTERFPDRRAREIWQELGANFGSDSNATTTPTQTVYQLDLPHADPASLDRSLDVLAEMMARARFEEAAVAAERPVVLAEKGRRPELTARFVDLSLPLFYAGLRYRDRDTIGTDATLNGATPAGLRSFYRRWYRPDRATLVMVGDADPAAMEALIRSRFGGWQAQGPSPNDPDFGRPAEVAQPVANLAYPGVPVTATVNWIRPYEAIPHTMAREQLFLEELLAARIINRRLEAHARGPSAFIGAGVGTSRTRGLANVTTLSITAREGQWRPALDESFAIIGDALRAPPSEAEIAREIQNLRTGVGAAVQGDPTMQSQTRAQQLVGAIEAGAVIASAETVRDNFERNAPLMTPERIGAAMQAIFTGLGPRLLLLTPAPVSGGNGAVAEGFAAARAVSPAERQTGRAVSFADLPSLGQPGREVSRRRIEDMDVTIVRFANGSSLTFKHTDFERGSVQVQLRFGTGVAGLAPDRPSLNWLSGLVAPSGLAGLDLDAMERLLTGRRIGLSFTVDEDAFVLSGQTSAGDLPDQLRLLATKLTHPSWDAALFARFRNAAVDSFDMHFSSASARAGRELNAVVRPNDQRWRPIERAEMAAVTVEQFRAYFTPLLARGPVHAIIVGDMSLEQAVEAMRTTVGSLPSRPEARPARNAAVVQPPAPNPEPRRFTHQGDPNQAYAMIGWSTLGGRDRIIERRALAVAASMFEAQLFDRFREQEGATYSPDAASLSSDAFRDWGIFYAAAEVRPENAPVFFRIAREIIADMAAHPAGPDEFTRTRNPIITGIERRVATNSYWIDALENWEADPREIENVRSYLADYRRLTAEDVRRTVAALVTDQGDWSMLVVPARGAPATTSGANPS